jgi:hypothetical protein
MREMSAAIENVQNFAVDLGALTNNFAQPCRNAPDERRLDAHRGLWNGIAISGTWT